MTKTKNNSLALWRSVLKDLVRTKKMTYGQAMRSREAKERFRQLKQSGGSHMSHSQSQSQSQSRSRGRSRGRSRSRGRGRSRTQRRS